ncbi:MAG: hypothetical protein F6K23_02185 [Okeania sp. SIO2C9]|uniref:hypothetical protein n=1 Tax=Okeania sp. SIO2C9 TaxID=2607791 RepID=UPI0013C12565|nr:hypothetical protein [Okeania sp. SIO2C9]NEQ71984.1 hypothetical protein [Okeania sp. SIO2C9]
MFYHRSLLEIAEYIFITASVVGIFANYIFDKPIIYAVGCVLISLLINLANRHKLAAQIQVIKFDTTGKLEQYQESISQMISQLQNSIAFFESTAKNLEEDRENLKIKPLLETMKSLSNRFNIQEQTIKLLQTELEMISQQFKQRPELQQINDLTSVIIDLQQFINKLPEWSDLRQHQFQKLEEKVNHALHKLEESIAEGKRETVEEGRRKKEEMDGDSNYNQL